MIRRFTSAVLDLTLNPAKVLCALMLSHSQGIEAVEFMISRKTGLPEWKHGLREPMLQTVVAHLPAAVHFTIGAVSLSHQFTLMRAAASQMIMLELHSAITRVFDDSAIIQLDALRNMHLFQTTATTLAAEFLTRVVSRISAPNLEVLTLGNLLDGNETAIPVVVERFPRLVKLLLLDDIPPSGVYLRGNQFPVLHMVVLQADPAEVMKGLRDCQWESIGDALRTMDGQIKQLQCCYRDPVGITGNLFRQLVERRLSVVDRPLSPSIRIVEGLRNPLPGWARFDDDAAGWGT
ncbi:hypothetical protein V5O48_012799 [Marasmius crinis-equi]|uniref:Uncharacterized protein n=1 Tax=Marasmius crinis-equi TaxID=585013 RepID=A0ABR3F234_9AGAR